MAVVVVSTGGTIASTPSSEGGDAAPELTGDDLVSGVPNLGDEHDIITHEFSNVPSTHFTLSDMHRLSREIAAFDDDDTIEGIVVTQGTDVLEESAYFVDRCYGGETPVVFTGAMRNPSLASPDGAGNLLASVRTAASSGARGRGAVVAFNDRVHRAAEVTKMHSMNPDAFRSPEFGPVGVFEEGQCRWRRPKDPSPTVEVGSVDQLPAALHAVYATVDMPRESVPAPDACAGICLAATGAGHIPPTIIPGLRTLVEHGVPIAVTTRCPEGRLARATYGFEGSERTLQELGCYFSERNLQKTRIDMLVGLAGDALEQLFDRPTVSPG